MNKLIFVVAVVAAGCGSPGVTQQSGAAACITASACGIIAGGTSACTQLVALVNDPAYASAFKYTAAEVNCIAAAGHDCAAAKRCLGDGATPAACTGNSKSCVGNLYEACTDSAGSGGNKGIQIFDCSAVGGQLCVASNGNVDCGLGSCSPGLANCVNNVVQSCTNGILHQEDCTTTASMCVPDVLGAHCRGTGAGCNVNVSLQNPYATVRCDGNVRVDCRDGQEARYDCAQDNLGCFATFNSPGIFGCALGGECTNTEPMTTCQGTKLTFCNKGKLTTIDCASSGFSACTTNGGGGCTP